jgi:DNA invertase Pin-like site-specific DNA recombinase
MSESERATHSAKITARHLERWACIYVRQSTLQQVEHHRESQANQYRLSERAHGLGWSDTRIRIIDSDLGKSGQDSLQRTGFTELLAEVALGHIGIIFGYEVSRLARNNSDWYRLLDLAAVFGTLIADSDGIYDPRLYNDRLLLGLKGTLSEAELHLLRLRLQAGRLSKVRSGHYRQCLPTGLVWLDNDTVVKDPDEQVQHVSELVFAKFAELGSCHGVFRHLRRAQILLPRRTTGASQGSISWKPASLSAVQAILTNPAYAGAFVYGRQQNDPTRRTAEHRATPRLTRSPNEWLYVRHDAYPAYLSWEQYLANQARIEANGTRWMERRHQATGAVREGLGLLQGLVLCGHCGRRMYTNYKPYPRYACNQPRQADRQLCCSVPGPSVDAVVTEAFFEAIRPAQLDLLAETLAAQRADHERLAHHWQEQVRRADYEAHLAERQYQAVDPANRLVAGTLERRWEEKLQQHQRVDDAYQQFLRTAAPTGLPPELCTQFRCISATLPDLWRAGRITPAQQKDLLRSLIAKVILTRVAADRVAVKIVWTSGHFSVREASVPIRREAQLSDWATLVERVRLGFAQGLNDQQIADQLTADGFHSARTAHISASKVYKIRLQHRWLRPHEAHRRALQLDGCWTTKGLAAQLGVSVRVILRQIDKQVIPPDYVHRQPESGVYLINNYPELLPSLQQALGCDTAIHREVVL